MARYELINEERPGDGSTGISVKTNITDLRCSCSLFDNPGFSYSGAVKWFCDSILVTTDAPVNAPTVYPGTAYRSVTHKAVVTLSAQLEYDTTYSYSFSFVSTEQGTFNSPTYTFTTESAPSGEPGQTYSPSPWNGTESDGAFDYKLSWSQRGDADTFRLYVGPTSGSLPQIDTDITNQYYYLDPGDFPSDSIVYWRVDAANESGVTSGVEWWFDPRVGAATTPTPATTSTGVSLTQSRVYWDAGALFQTFDVYVDTVKVKSDTTNEYFDLDDLAGWPLTASTLYSWYVVSKNVHSSDTGTTWTFTTGADAAVEEVDTGDRPTGYDADKFWDVTGQAWADVPTSGGGRYQSQIVIIGHNVIYFGSI